MFCLHTEHPVQGREVDCDQEGRDFPELQVHWLALHRDPPRRGHCRGCTHWRWEIQTIGTHLNNFFVSVGIIDTNPEKFKEGRFISTNSDKNEIGSSSKLLEVDNPNAPNILTNNPDFFNDDYPPKNAGNINIHRLEGRLVR